MLLLLLACFILGAGAQQCFNFSGTPTAYITFETELLNLNQSANFRLQFKTPKPNGILYYASGPHDYESLFMKDGYLNYLLFNSESHGHGSTSGAHHVSNMTLNNNQWHTVRFFRNRRDSQNNEETGLVVDGLVFKDDLPRRDVSLNQPLYFGGYMKPLSKRVGNFEGKIRSLSEVTQGHDFIEPKYTEGVNRGPRCSDDLILQ